MKELILVTCFALFTATACLGENLGPLREQTTCDDLFEREAVRCFEAAELYPSSCLFALIVGEEACRNKFLPVVSYRFFREPLSGFDGDHIVLEAGFWDGNVLGFPLVLSRQSSAIQFYETVEGIFGVIKKEATIINARRI